MPWFLWYIFLGIAPAIFFSWYIYKKDEWEPEPKAMVIKTFFLGMIAIPFAIVFELLLFKVWDLDPFQVSTSSLLCAISCFLVVAPIEEFFKYSGVRAYIYPESDFNEPVDGVVYMVAAAMGFAGVENVMYIIKSDNPDLVGILRGVLSTPSHAIFSACIGVGIGYAKFSDVFWKKAGLILLGFFIAIVLHGAYNFFLMQGHPEISIALMGSAGIILLDIIRRMVKNSPFNQKKTLQL